MAFCRRCRNARVSYKVFGRFPVWGLKAVIFLQPHRCSSGVVQYLSVVARVVGLSLFGGPSAHFSSSLCLLLKAVHVIGLVPICHCKGDRLMSLRRAFSLVPFFTSLLHIVFFRRLWMRYCYYLSMCPCKGGRFMSSTLRTSNVSTALLHLVFFFRLLIVIFLKALNVV